MSAEDAVGCRLVASAAVREISVDVENLFLIKENRGGAELRSIHILSVISVPKYADACHVN